LVWFGFLKANRTKQT